MSLTFTAAVRANKPKRNVGVISALRTGVIAIQKNGIAWSWGTNTSGQLGDGTIVNKNTPANLAGTIKTFCKISARFQYSIAIDKNGRAWGWGRNGYGQLGNNAITSQLTPVSVAGQIKTFCQISAGGSHSLAIDKNGRAWGWGYNGGGSIGDNTTISKRTPVSVLGAIKTFCQIAAGQAHSAAIDKNGRAWGWGYNYYGSVGIGIGITHVVMTPMSVAGAVKTFCKIVANGLNFGGFCLAIDKNGRAWGWGMAYRGQLGAGAPPPDGYYYTPVSVAGTIKTFCQIAAGHLYSLAIDKNGRAWAWGDNANGILGINSLVIASILTPMSIAGAIKTFCTISAGQNVSYAIDKNSRLWAWGTNNAGQLGIKLPTFYNTPISIVGATKTFCEIGGEAVTIAGSSALAIDKNGLVWGWGVASDGQLGNNSTDPQFMTPVSIAGARKTFCKVDTNGFSSMAIDKNGRLWSWGNNSNGQLGNNSTTNFCTPISVLGAVKTFCQIGAGSSYSLAIDKNGRAWAWGQNTNGQLGDNTTISKNTPISVRGAVKTFCQINSGINFAIAIDKNGRAWGWGYNSFGMLGDNTVTQRLTPVSVAGAVKTFCQISVGYQHSVAIDKNGRAWGWGVNSSGQLGDNSTLSRRTPVSVAGTVKTFCQIAVNVTNSVAIDKNGRAWGWGSGNFTGDGTATVRLTPVSVAGAVKTFCKVIAPYQRFILIDKNGRAWGWGSVTGGGIGNNQSNVYYTPVRVCTI